MITNPKPCRRVKDHTFALFYFENPTLTNIVARQQGEGGLVGDLVGEDLSVATLQGVAEPAPGVSQGLPLLLPSVPG